MLAVIDYGAGNLRSVLHALNHLNAPQIRVVHHADELTNAEKIILPGVGAFGAGMAELHKKALIEPIRQAVAGGTPYLGICLGMQFLFETSDEMGTHEGLGILPGRVTRFEDRPSLKVPHMGWNVLSVSRPSPLLEGLPAEPYVYFVHSYYCVPANPQDVLATVNYGHDFCVSVQKDHIYGVQFHPEKSQKNGLRILQNFLNL